MPSWCCRCSPGCCLLPGAVHGVFARNGLHVLEVRDLEGTYRLDGGSERLVDATASSLLAQGLSRRTKGSQDLRSVESLAGAMIAEAHGFFASAQRMFRNST